MTNPAAAEINSRRRKDWVLLRSYVFDEDVPKTVNVQKHSLEYVGSVSSKKYLTGIYGTNSGDAGGFLATNWAMSNKLRIFFLDIWAEIPNFHASRAQMTREILKHAHWLHLDRMSVELREEIKDSMIGWIKRKYGGEVAKNAQDTNVQQLVLTYPELAIKLLDDDEDIGMIVHPIHTKFDEGSAKQISLWAATIRRDRINIRGAEIRYKADVKCIL